MSRANRRAAAARLEAAAACLTADERRALEAGFSPCPDDAAFAAIHNGLGLTGDAYVALVQSACDKLDAYFASVDAAAARRAGRLQ